MFIDKFSMVFMRLRAIIIIIDIGGARRRLSENLRG